MSQHLAKLRWGRIVQARQEGTHMYYRLANEHAVRLVVDAVYQAEHSLDADPAHHRTTHPQQDGQTVDGGRP